MSAQHKDSFAYTAFRNSLKEHQKSLTAGNGRPGSAASRRTRRPQSAKLSRRKAPSAKTTAAGSGLAALRAKSNKSGLKKPPTTAGPGGVRHSASQPDLPSSVDLLPGMRSLDINLIPLEENFKKSCERLLALWEELRIPMRDREFFFRAYCQAASPENVARVKAQLDLVLRHRDRTLSVLEAINEREAALAAVAQLLLRLSAPSANDAEGAGAFVEFEAVAGELLQLRRASVAVVAAVCEWRKDLWRPQPFVWKGINYLVKLKGDASGILAEGRARAALERSYGVVVREPVFFSEVSGREEGHALQMAEGEAAQVKQHLVVLQTEHKLQREVYAENKRLLMSGYYIPLLRWSPDDAVFIKPRALGASPAEDDSVGGAAQEEARAGEEREGTAEEAQEERKEGEGPDDRQANNSECEQSPGPPKHSAKEHLNMLREFQERIKSEL